VQWQHPRTGAVTPPASPAVKREPNRIVLMVVRAVGGTFVFFCGMVAFGASPVISRFFLDEGKAHRVVQVNRR